MLPASENIPLDSGRSASLEVKQMPEILVCPSDLAPFAKVSKVTKHKFELENGESPVKEVSTDDIICINPGRLTKGSTAGTFAHVYVNSKSEAIINRCKVEIRKL